MEKVEWKVEVKPKLRPSDDTGKGAEKRDTTRRRQKQRVLRSGWWELNWESGAPRPHHGSVNNQMYDLGQVLSLPCASVSPCVMRELLSALLGMFLKSLPPSPTPLFQFCVLGNVTNTFLAESRKLPFALVHPAS